MALTKEFSLPISGGFKAAHAYIKIDDITPDDVAGTVRYVIRLYRDEDARAAHGEVYARLRNARAAMQAAQEGYNAALALPVTNAETQLTKHTTFQKAEKDLRAARVSLELAQEAISDETNHPFQRHEVSDVLFEDVATNGVIDKAKLYAHAKATWEPLADAEDLL